MIAENSDGLFGCRDLAVDAIAHLLTIDGGRGHVFQFVHQVLDAFEAGQDLCGLSVIQGHSPESSRFDRPLVSAMFNKTRC